MAITNGLAASDFPGRYHHIDQILDKPGPRTDPSFAAGEEVGALRCLKLNFETSILGQEFPTE
jgi:hypothetical protein